MFINKTVLYILASWCNGTGDTQHMGLMIPRKLFDSTRCYHKFYIIDSISNTSLRDRKRDMEHCFHAIYHHATSI